MGKLHELLAVKKDLASRANQICKETAEVFKKGHLFYGSLRTYESFEEKSEQTAESPEQEFLSYTVGEKMDWFGNEFGRMLDVEYQIDTSNTAAGASVQIGGLDLPTLPASFLMNLLGLLDKIKKVYQHAQVLDPKNEWMESSEMGDGVFRTAQALVTYRTKKSLKHKVLTEATKEHPAQIEKWAEDERIGKFVKKQWSGCITAAQKADLLGRLDSLIQATRKALSKANEQEHDADKIAKQVFQWLHQGIPLGGVARDGVKDQAESNDEVES